ncbi:high-affinity nickel-transport protein [Hirsutella rhossiliensis]|uniref:Nickel/cobalt efflux system n=1 Tax=Hirsutella rhossiliensis TaxID=111463 RepID=A0A9P8SLB0_9HYPO|nr:high-affinity nickel-transport protein [Hirsutella rhossiliensis]KAH0966064.1 high-affinity nickel-transport protein [Hirsutella rhossiliensis]
MGRIKLPAKPRCLRGIPTNSIAIIAVLILVNLLVWAVIAAAVLSQHPALVSAAVLSYTLGLRHGLDADHISAIDLMTRRLIAADQRPATVGTFFSLGHSTVVIVTCIVVAATTGALKDRFQDFARVGNIIGTAVSAAFLIVLCLANGRGGPEADADASADAAMAQFQLPATGFLGRLAALLFRTIDRPWKMWPLGLVFGLGFDTSSEVAILALASVQATKGTSIWLILVFPILFTAGMCLVDTTDGASMMALYTSKSFSRDPVAALYYSIVLTAITIAVSAFIGIVQVLSLVQNIASPRGAFWHGFSALTDHFEIVGGSICGLFVLVGLGSVLVYRPWRRRIEKRHRQGLTTAEESGLDSNGHESCPQEPPLRTEN